MRIRQYSTADRLQHLPLLWWGQQHTTRCRHARNRAFRCLKCFSAQTFAFVNHFTRDHLFRQAADRHCWVE